ncbi:MAG: hypothetical protein LBH06_04215 [Rikenellaceae bacterium]|jgi:hypothetical protein|nr:hypothetical protein [Rikenellaceae bacterium]
MTTVIIEDNSPQAERLLDYIRTLPFVTVVKDNGTRQSVWETAIAEGTVSLEEFDARFKEAITNAYKA